MKTTLSLIALLAVAGSASAALVQSQTGPAAKTYSNGSGTGFGGTLGNGSITFDAQSNPGNLRVSLTPGNALNDIVVIQLDTKNGGFKAGDVVDTSDGGRRASTVGIQNGTMTWPGAANGMTSYTAGAGGGTVDYALVIASFGSVLFEYQTGNFQFLQFNGAQTIDIPLASIGSPTGNVDWFAYYTADSIFASNETMPSQPAINGGGNPGFGPAPYDMINFNRYAIPTPGSAALLGLAGLAGLRRRRA
ncbi:MAG: hypothetical protein IBJ11_02955 [Phycisphaerales bacterium]|nr:hypothetical protein [Phycisphaerales bacterium]